MSHNYGLPYKGSKNSIAERIVQCLPKGGRFLDACCCGGAISHAAYLSGRYASVTGYDINKSIITLLDAVMVKGGQIDYENFPLITKEEFYAAKERCDDGNLHDAVVRYVASFGFNGQDDSEDAVCDDTPDGVRPATGRKQCPETDAGIDSTNQGVNNG